VYFDSQIHILATRFRIPDTGRSEAEITDARCQGKERLTEGLGEEETGGQGNDETGNFLDSSKIFIAASRASL